MSFQDVQVKHAHRMGGCRSSRIPNRKESNLAFANRTVGCPPRTALPHTPPARPSLPAPQSPAHLRLFQTTLSSNPTCRSQISLLGPSAPGQKKSKWPHIVARQLPASSHFGITALGCASAAFYESCNCCRLQCSHGVRQWPNASKLPGPKP